MKPTSSFSNQHSSDISSTSSSLKSGASHNTDTTTDRPHNQKREGNKLKERLAKQKLVWRKESLEKRPKSQPLVAKHGLSQQAAQQAAFNTNTSNQPRRSLRPTSPTYESAFTRQVVNRPASPNTKLHATHSFSKTKRTPSPNISHLSEDAIKRKIERAKRAQLYLLQQAGPNSFIIGGREPTNQRYKVIVGPQTCTCGKSQCIHVMFVMVRVFKLSDQDSRLYTKILKNFEVESLFKKYEHRRKQRLSNSQHMSTSDSDPNTESNDDSINQSDLTRPAVISAPTIQVVECTGEMEVTCPICLLEFEKEEEKIECDHCHNKLHQMCMAIWYQLVSKQGDVLSCPLCRMVWPSCSKLSLENLPSEKDGTSISSEYVTGSPNNLGVSPVSGFADIEPSTLLPRSQPIPEEHRASVQAWIDMFGEDLIGCLFTKSSWAIRESALRQLSRAIIMKLSNSSPSHTDLQTNQPFSSFSHNHQPESDPSASNQLTEIGQSIIDRVLDTSCQILTMMVTDPVYKVYVASLRSLRTMLSYCALPDVSKLKLYMQPVIQNIILKCADGNRKTNQLSLSTLCEFAKDQDGELAIARELGIQDQEGLGGCLYVLECCIAYEQLDGRNLQWLNGRLITMNQLLEDYSSTFTIVDGEQQWFAALTNNLLLPMIDFASKAIAKSATQQKTLRLSKKIILQCAKPILSIPGVLTKIGEILNQVDADIKRKLEKKLLEMSLSMLHHSTHNHHVSFNLTVMTASQSGDNNTTTDVTADKDEEEPAVESLFLPDDRKLRRQLSFGQLYQPVTQESHTASNTSQPLAPSSSVEYSDEVNSVDSSTGSCESVDADYVPTDYVPASENFNNMGFPSATSTQEMHIETSMDLRVSDMDESIPCKEGDSTLTEYNKEGDSTLTEYNVDDLDEADHPDTLEARRSPRKLSRGRVIIGSKPQVTVIRSPTPDNDDEEPEDVPEGACDTVDGPPQLQPSGTIPTHLNRDESMGFEPISMELPLDGAEFQAGDANTDNMSEPGSSADDISDSVSLPISSGMDTSDDGLGDIQLSQPSKAVPFKKYRKHKHKRSRTDPVKVDELSAKRNSSPRYHSDPAVGDSTSSSSTPRSPPTSSSSPSAGSNDQVVQDSQTKEHFSQRDKPKTRPYSAFLEKVEVHVPTRSSSLKTSRGSQIPQLKKRSSLKSSDHCRSASDSSAFIYRARAPPPPQSPTTTSRASLSRHSSGAKTPPLLESVGLQPAGMINSAVFETTLQDTLSSSKTSGDNGSQNVRLGSQSPPRVKREIQLPQSPPSTPPRGADRSQSPVLNGVTPATAIVHPRLNDHVANPIDDSEQSDSLLRAVTEGQASHTYESSITGVLAASTSGSSDDHKTGSDSLLVEDFSDSAMASPYERPVSFKSEVALFSPRDSPYKGECHCKDEVELEEAIALAKAMELSSEQPALPRVPGLSSGLDEETITIHVQSDDIDGSFGKVEYLENVHWKRGMMIGTGAFSTCYQCRDVKTGIIMAVKQISFCRNSEHEQDSICKTVVDEIRMMAALNHPNIVRILGATKTGAHFNMFVEWMPGGSVSHLLEVYGVFSEPVMCSYSQQVLKGLAYLHDHGILHRDMKGANLLIDSTGKHLRIGDFGACARLASSMTGAGELKGQLLGTIAFMAPEVLRGEHYGRACDVWSVGCVIIEMATTKPPWNASNVSNHLKLIFKIASANTSPPIPDNLTPALRDLTLRCLEVDSKYRPSAKELLQHPLFTQYGR